MVGMAIGPYVITEVTVSTSPRPMCILMSLMSAVSTEPSAFTSPTRNVMVPDASTEPEAPFTPATLTAISEPSQLTFPSSTVTVSPLNVVLITLPQVVVEAPEMLVTSSEKVNTIVLQECATISLAAFHPGQRNVEVTRVSVMLSRGRSRLGRLSLGRKAERASSLRRMPFASFRESVRTIPGAKLLLSLRDGLTVVAQNKHYRSVTSTTLEQIPVSGSHTWKVAVPVRAPTFFMAIPSSAVV